MPIRRSPGARRSNVAWKVEVPGRGTASPIVWGDKVFLLTAVPFGDSRAAGRAGGLAAPAAAGAPWACGQVAAGGRGRRGAQEVRAHRFTVLAFDRETGDLAWERVAREALPHEGVPTAERQLRLRVGGDRRRASLCVLRIVGAVRLRPRRGVAVGGRPRRPLHAQRLRRGDDAGAARRHAGGDLGPHRRPVVRRGARRPDRRGTLAVEPGRDRHLGHAARRRARRAHAGDHAGHEPGLRL